MIKRSIADAHPPFAIHLDFIQANMIKLTHRVGESKLPSGTSYLELSMGPFCVIQSNLTHQLTDPTQPNPLQVEKFGPNPTQHNTTNKFNCLVQPNLIWPCSKCINIILSNFSTSAIVHPTQPNPQKAEKSRPNPTQPNPWTTLVYASFLPCE